MRYDAMGMKWGPVVCSSCGRMVRSGAQWYAAGVGKRYAARVSDVQYERMVQGQQVWHSAPGNTAGRVGRAACWLPQVTVAVPDRRAQRDKAV